MSLTEKQIKRIEDLIKTGKEIQKLSFSSIQETAKLDAWEASCLTLFSNIFSEKTVYSTRLVAIYNNETRASQVSSTLEFLEMVKQDVLSDLGYGRKTKESIISDSLGFIEQVCLRFHLIVRQMRKRHEDRPTLDVNDEYDVQDLMHSLLRLNFNNIIAEEWTPTYAVGASRMDFLLKNEDIVVETKKTRETRGSKELCDELIVDIERYQTHPNCKTLFCFVYDPEGRIPNPENLEKDLSKTHNGFTVKVLVAPKGF